MKYLRPTKEQLSQAATLTIAAYVVPQFQMPFRAQLLHKDVNPTEFNKHWLQYLTGERRALRHVAEALVMIMTEDMSRVPHGLGSYFTVMQQLLNVEDAALRHKLLVSALIVHLDMVHTQRSMFENTIKDFVQALLQSKGTVQGSVVREVEDIIFATAVTEYMKEAAEQAAAEKEGAATQEEAPNE
jgi:hypothetical protein